MPKINISKHSDYKEFYNSSKQLIEKVGVFENGIIKNFEYEF